MKKGTRLSMHYITDEPTERYSHDALGQLTGVEQLSASGTTQLATYTYNPVGEIISQTTGGAEQDPSGGSVSNSTFNGLNQLTAKTVYDLFGRVTGSYEYAYDLRGNMVKETDTQTGTTQTYEYDATNKMVRGVNHAGEVSEYEYNALGVLVGKETGTYAVDYTSLAPSVLVEYGTDGIIKRHTYGGLLERIQTTLSSTQAGQKATYFIQNDRLGSGISATDASGSLTAQAVLDEWGAVVSKSKVNFANAEVDLLPNFTNHTYDEVLGVYYAQARFYDPAEQRFLARDSHWDAFNRVYGDAGNALAGSVLGNTAVGNVPSISAIRQSANLYTYAINNPLLYTDPLGQFTSIEDYEYQVQQQRSFGHRMPDPNDYAAVGAGRGGYYTTFGCAPKSNGILDYLGRSADQVIRGNYSENVTLLGTVGQVAIGFTGLDFVADIRDVTYDITHWKNTPEHFGQTALDVLGLLPIVGGLIKGGDEVVTLVKSAAKLENVNVVDNVVETTEIIDGLGDAAKGAGKSTNITNDVLEAPRAGSALKTDKYHAFNNIVDNYAGQASKFDINNGTLYQIEGSLNGVQGRFEWIIDTSGRYTGQVSHRMFVPGGTVTEVHIKP